MGVSASALGLAGEVAPGPHIQFRRSFPIRPPVRVPQPRRRASLLFDRHRKANKTRVKLSSTSSDASLSSNSESWKCISVRCVCARC